MSDIILPIDGDIRPLEAKVNRFASKGINLNLRNNLSQPLGRITGQVSEFNKSLEASNARVLAFGASAGAVYAVGRAFQEVIKASVEVEKQLLDINVVLNASQQNLDRFGKSLFDIARNTANPFSSVAKAATELARQGLGVEETLKRTSDALILSRLSGLDAAKSVEALTAAVNSFSKAGLTSTQVINKLANVDAGFAVSSADLAEAISRVGSTAQDVGVDIDELISLVTAAQQTTARGGSVIGNSFKTIFTRLQRSDTLTELENMGVAVRDLTGETLPATQILQNLAKTFNTLSSSQKASVAETVGGVYQINILRAALGDLGKQYGVYNTALNTSRNSTNEAIKRNEELNKSNDALLKQLLTDFKQAGKEIGDIVFAPTIKDSAGFISKLLEDFRKPEESRSAGSQLATEVLKGFGDFVSGPGIAIATAGLAKIFLNLAKFSAEAFKGFMGIQSGADKLAAAQQRINTILAQNPSLIDAAVSKSSNMLAVEQKILSIIQAQNAARVQAAQISTKMAPAVIVAEAAAAKRVKGRAEGFIPNFSNLIDQDQIIENLGAANHKGGYKAGKAYRTNLYDGTGKSIPSIINTAEKRKDFINSEGKKASLVIPPNGFAKGFVPNFSRISERVKRAQLTGQQTAMGRFKLSGSQEEYFAQYAKKKGLKDRQDYGLADGELYIPSKIYDDFNFEFRRNQESLAIGRMKKNPDEFQSGLRRGKKGKSSPYPYSIVYPGAGLSSGEYPTYGTVNNTPISFTAFPFPVGKGDFGKETYALVQKSIIDVSKKILSDAGVKPKVLSREKFTNKIRSNLSLDAINSVVGNAFEAGLLASINVTPSDRSRNLDLDQGDMRALAKNFPTARRLVNKKGGDFKPSVSADSLNSMAAKIARAEKLLIDQNPVRQKKVKAANTDLRLAASSGFMPSEEALKIAIKREKMAGYHSNQIRVGQDNSLVTKENPLGLGVYNTKDEPSGLKQGIKRYSLREAKVAGRASGFIPNFADKEDGGNFGGRLFTAALTASFVTPIINSNLENKLSQDDLTEEQKKSTEGMYTLTKALENATSGAFLGGIFGKKGQVLGSAIGAGVGLANAQGTIAGVNDVKRQREISGSVSKLQDVGTNLDELNAGIAPNLNDLILELNKKETADAKKIKELTDEISKSISESKVDSELKQGLLNNLKSQPDLVIPNLNRTKTANTTQQRIEERRLGIDQTLSKNNQSTGVENFLGGLRRAIGSGAETDTFKKFENFVMSTYNKREISVPNNLKTDKSRQDLGTEVISELALNLNTEQFNKLGADLLGASESANKFIDVLISARNNLGLATGDLDELKEALKIDPKLDAATLKSFLKSLSGVSKNVASSVTTGIMSVPGRIERVSNYSGANESYQTFEDAEDRDYQDLFPYERKAKEQEAQAQKNVMEREIKNLPPEERKKYERKATLRKGNEFFKMGVSPDQLKEIDPKFSKELDEAIVADVKEKDAIREKEVEKLTGKPITAEQKQIINPPKLYSEAVNKIKEEQFKKVAPFVTQKDLQGNSIDVPSGQANIGETIKVIAPISLSEDQKKKNEELEKLKQRANETAKTAESKATEVTIPENKPTDPMRITPQGNLEDNKPAPPKDENLFQQVLKDPVTASILTTAAGVALPGAIKGAFKGGGKLIGKLSRKKNIAKTAIQKGTEIVDDATRVVGTQKIIGNAGTELASKTIRDSEEAIKKEIAENSFETFYNQKTGALGKKYQKISLPKNITTKIPSGTKSQLEFFPTFKKAGGKIVDAGKAITRPLTNTAKGSGSLIRSGAQILGRASGAAASYGSGLLATNVGALASTGVAGMATAGGLMAGAGALGYGAGTLINKIPTGGGKNIGDRLADSTYNLLFSSQDKKLQQEEESLQKFLEGKRKRKQEEKDLKTPSQQGLDAQARLTKATEARKTYDLQTKADQAKSNLTFSSIFSPSLNAPAPMSTKGLFAVKEPGIENIPGISKEATAFSHYDKFFKSQEDLNKYRNSVSGNTDEIKESYMAKREKINRQQPSREENVLTRSYDKEDENFKKKQQDQIAKKEKELQEQEAKQNQSTSQQTSTNNFNINPNISLNAGANKDELQKLIVEKFQEFSQGLMTEIDQKLSDRDKGLTKPPMGMVGGKKLVS